MGFWGDWHAFGGSLSGHLEALLFLAVLCQLYFLLGLHLVTQCNSLKPGSSINSQQRGLAVLASLLKTQTSDYTTIMSNVKSKMYIKLLIDTYIEWWSITVSAATKGGKSGQGSRIFFFCVPKTNLFLSPDEHTQSGSHSLSFCYGTPIINTWVSLCTAVVQIAIPKWDAETLMHAVVCTKTHMGKCADLNANTQLQTESHTDTCGQHAERSLCGLAPSLLLFHHSEPPILSVSHS